MKAVTLNNVSMDVEAKDISVIALILAKIFRRKFIFTAKDLTINFTGGKLTKEIIEAVKEGVQ